MLSDTVSTIDESNESVQFRSDRRVSVHVSSSVVSKPIASGLEINSILPSRQIRRRKIGRTRDEFRYRNRDLGKQSFGEFPRSDGLVLGGERRQSSFPTRRKFSRKSSSNVGVLLRVLLSVRGEHLIPGGFGRSSFGGDFGVERGGVGGNGEEFLGVESEFRLDGDGVVDLEGVTVDAVSSLVLGSVTDSSSACDISTMSVVRR